MKNNRSFFKVSFVVLAFFLLTACPGSDPESAPQTRKEVPTALKGTWEGKCSVGEDGKIFKQTVFITDNELVTNTNGYDDNDLNCQTILGLWEHRYNLTFGDEITTIDGQAANNIDLEFVTSTHTMKTQAVTDFWNAQQGGFCGKSDWVLDEPFEITGKECNFVKAASGDFLYDIIKLNAASEPDFIQLGVRTSDINNRPKILIPPTYEKRIVPE